MQLRSEQLSLQFGFSFEDLYSRDGLARMDEVFRERLRASDPTLHDRLAAARSNPSSLPHKDQSELIIEVAPHLEDFIGELFGITAEIRDLQARHNRLAPLYTV